MFRACMGDSIRSLTFMDEEDDTFIPVEPPIPTVDMLLEIVGATNLPTKPGPLPDQEIPPDPYCIVSIVRSNSNNNSNNNAPEVVHRTQSISKDEHPIWTVKTKSLCVVPIPKYQSQQHQRIVENFKLINNNSNRSKADNGNHGNNTKIPTDIPSDASFATAASTDSLMENSVVASPNQPNCLIIQVRNGKTSLGKVEVSFQHILQCKGERQEFTLVSDDDQEQQEDDAHVIRRRQSTLQLLQQQPPSKLALRFRPAKPEEITFLQNMRRNRHNVFLSAYNETARTLSRSISSVSSSSGVLPSHDETATDVDFRRVIKKELFSSYRKRDEKTGETLLRLQPAKQVGDDKPIEWMTKEQIRKEALLPSTKWVECADGECGTLYLEIIGCDQLPISDYMEQSSDPFVTIVFEDTMVRTQVLFNTCYPRWMPWSTRAFAFNVQHPGALLYLGVFDHDENLPLQKQCHDPIGRTVINTINFESSVTYMLQYDLIDSNQLDSPRGTITVRLRIEWADENEALKLALTAPPRMIINVETSRSWHVLHYLLYGAINMEKASMSSVRLYMTEFYEIWGAYCYFLDVVANILLWRGRVNLSVFGHRTTVWFPIQSAWLFLSVTIAYEKPSFAPAIFIYGLAWIMISINYCNSRHPYPWYRVKKFESLLYSLVFGSSPTSCSSTHEANSGTKEKATYDSLDKLKSERMMALMMALIRTGLKAYRIYSGTNITSIVDTTPDNTFYMFSDKLYYPHMLLKYFCNYSRSFRNFINWKSHSSFPKTLNLLILGTFCLLAYPVLPYAGRILIWALLSPLMKIVDIVWVRYIYKTNEDLLDDIANGRTDDEYWFLPFFDSIVEHDSFHSMRKEGRLVAEDAVKLKDMRETLYGSWSETVPWVDNSRRPCPPLPASSATPRNADCVESERGAIWKFARGKRLEGSMIMACPGCPSKTPCVGNDHEHKKDQ